MRTHISNMCSKQSIKQLGQSRFIVSTCMCNWCNAYGLVTAEMGRVDVLHLVTS